MMKSLTIILLLTSLFVEVQAQTELNVESTPQWFWHVSVGTQLQDNNWGRFIGAEQNNQQLQFGVGKSRTINDRWSFLQEYRMRVYRFDRQSEYAITLSRPIGEIEADYSSKVSGVGLEVEVPFYWQFNLNDDLFLTGGPYAGISMFAMANGTLDYVGKAPNEDYRELTTIDRTT